MDITELWYSEKADQWHDSLAHYWNLVRPANMQLEKSLMKLHISEIQGMSPEEWFQFLSEKYFHWKYTAPNRYATTTKQLNRYLSEGRLDELDQIRVNLLNLDVSNIKSSVVEAKKISGLGTAGASGLLSILYPEYFGTVDQFTVKALCKILNIPEIRFLNKMNPENLSLSDSEILINIMRVKAIKLNELFHSDSWTPRKIDMILWSIGR